MRIVNLIIGLLAVVAFLAGAFFVYIGVSSLDNSLSIAAGAAMGSAFFMLVVLYGISRIVTLQEAQLEALDEQTKLLKYIANQQRKEGR
jgi:uncharacterized BrkB/YihY/UPF0761 family membrane protein